MPLLIKINGWCELQGLLFQGSVQLAFVQQPAPFVSSALNGMQNETVFSPLLSLRQIRNIGNLSLWIKQWLQQVTGPRINQCFQRKGLDLCPLSNLLLGRMVGFFSFLFFYFLIFFLFCFVSFSVRAFSFCVMHSLGKCFSFQAVLLHWSKPLQKASVEIWTYNDVLLYFLTMNNGSLNTNGNSTQVEAEVQRVRGNSHYLQALMFHVLKKKKKSCFL